MPLTRRQLIATPIVTAATAGAHTLLSPTAALGTTHPELVVTPLQVRSDEAFDVTIFNVEPGTEVTIRSSFLGGRETRYRAEATWVADEWGVVSCSGTAPIDGDFDVADSMGLVWAAAPSFDGFYLPVLHGPDPITITASIGDVEIAAVTVERETLPAGYRHEEIRSESLAADYFAPIDSSAAPAPAVIVIGGSDGGIGPYVRYTAALLAAHGYAALAVAYFGIRPLPAQLERIPLEHFGGAIEWLQSHPDVDGDRIGMLGYSRGGEATLLAAAHYPEISVAVSYVGSGVGTPYSDPPTPAFTWNGEPVPHLTEWPTEEFEAAAIPVDHINGPVLLISGDADQLWPASLLSQVARDRLQEHDHPWPNQFLHYPGAGHGILAPYIPMTFQRDHPELPFGGTPYADQVASVSAWRAVLNTLEWRLRV